MELTCLNPGRTAPPPSFVQKIRNGESLFGRTTTGVLPVVPSGQVGNAGRRVGRSGRVERGRVLGCVRARHR